MDSIDIRSDIRGRLERATAFAVSTSDAVSRFGGRLAVLHAFAEAVLPRLDAAQSAEVARRFRRVVEHIMSLTDDVAMPAGYHSAFLEQTNELLDVLEAKRPAAR
jgi:hypothetical protein